MVDLAHFRDWLRSKNYSDSTIRNYLVDVGHYLRSTIHDPFSPDSISQYLKSTAADPNYPRHLSSLSQFFQYALDQQLIKVNPLHQAKKSLHPAPPKSDIHHLISTFQAYLEKHHHSPSTIRNYINDLQQYISFCASNPS